MSTTSRASGGSWACTANHRFDPDRLIVDQEWEERPVEIGADCWIGIGVCILPGARLGDGCVVGAGSVVAGKLEANSVAAGNPVRKDREPLMRILFLQQQPCVRALKYAVALRSACPWMRLAFAYQGKTLGEWYGSGDELFGTRERNHGGTPVPPMALG
jgi:Hexapeptide repeat of succinyl-transferase